MTKKSEKSPTPEIAENAEIAAETEIAWDASPAPGPRKSFIFNGVEFAFRYCPPGTFAMGSAFEETGLVEYANEYPRHEVTLTRGFWTLENPVTQGQYEAVVGSNPSWFSPTREVRPADGTPGKALTRYLADPKSAPARLPVESVSWEDAQDFLKALNAAFALPDGLTFRLPWEAEWEYACRAGSETAYFWGDRFRVDGVNGGANCESGRPRNTILAKKIWNRPTEVGEYGANAWGLVDMSGNVEEWTLDWFGPYPEGPAPDPKSLKTDYYEGFAGQGYFRATRGGSWTSSAQEVRSARRRFREQHQRVGDLGFRFVVGNWDAETAAAISEPWDEAAEAAVVAAILTARENAPPADALDANSDAAWDSEPPAGTRKAFIFNGVEFAFRYCPPGTFVEGAPSERGYNRPGDRRLTTISRGFWVAETPTTLAQFAALDADSQPPRTRGALPVSKATFETAVAFCESLNALTLAPEGFEFRLLTSAEWEYVARAWTLGPLVVPEPDPDDKKARSPRPVRQDRPNAWGLFDVLGNVWEWTSDESHRRRSAPAVDPVAPKGGKGASFQTMRGGVYARDDEKLPNALRVGFLKDQETAGFRIALAPRRATPTTAADSKEPRIND